MTSDERARHHDEVLLDLIDATTARWAPPARADRDRGRAGPFTGLRVGLVTARTIAAVLDILYGLSSLTPWRISAGRSPGPATVAVALDARRREIYHARYRRGPSGQVTREDGPAVDPPAAVFEQLRACDLLVGSGTRLYPELLPATAELIHADAGHLLQAAAQQATQGEDLSSTEPMYLREPDAAKPTARKSALGR